MSAIRNTHMYEMALMAPGMPNVVPPIYTCGYSDQPADLPSDGRVPVPDGPGLGVTYDWDYITSNQTQQFTYQ
jgi:L-alanine-DL-glutamate epimerase-like enolase superfamily enzyme